jgi:tetratricopeptide (TPR) repeat protein
MYNLAMAYRDAGRSEDAVPLLRDLLFERRNQQPVQPLEIAQALSLLGLVLTELDQADQAEPNLREGLTLREQHMLPGHWQTANARSLLGGCLAKQRKFAEAEALLLEGYDGLIRAADTPPERLPQALERLVQLYTAWGHNDKAREWQQKLDEAKKLGKQ